MPSLSSLAYFLDKFRQIIINIIFSSLMYTWRKRDKNRIITMTRATRFKRIRLIIIIIIVTIYVGENYNISIIYERFAI